MAYSTLKLKMVKLFKTNTSRQKINVNGAYKPIKQGERKIYYVFLYNTKYNYGRIFINYIKEIERIKNIKISLIYLPTYSPERFFEYIKKALSHLYYEKFFNFSQGIIDFFERCIKEKYYKSMLKHFIGEKFQIICG